MRRLFLSVVFLGGFSFQGSPAAPTLVGVSQFIFRVPSGISCTTTTANAAQATVQTAVNNATTGDTICVPADAAETWTSAVTLSSTKDLTVAGNGGDLSAMNCAGTPGTSGYSCTYTGGTVLTCANGCFVVDFAVSHRIAGFSMTNATTNELISGSGEVNTGEHFRIDHNRLISTGGWAPIRFFGQQNGNHPQGVWDHNRLQDVAIHQNGSLWGMDEDTAQDEVWAKQPVMGDTTEVVYIEANHWSSVNTNATDGNYGCRYVARYNTLTAGTFWMFEVHGMQGYNRGCQRVEVYGNYLTALTNGGLSEMRGGTGFYFLNDAAMGVSANINLTIDRSEYDEGAGNFDPVEECGTGGADGNSPAGVDQQTGGANGWRCRDQVGTSHDSVQWTHTPLAAPTNWGAWAQVQRPMYAFLNGSGIAITPNTQGDIENKIVVGREVFCDSGHASCSSGVQVGTSLPGSCTVGQGYWKTDEGTWNSVQGGTDGRFYRCTSTDTWTLDYTPQAYPHPWAN